MYTFNVDHDDVGKQVYVILKVPPLSSPLFWAVHMYRFIKSVTVQFVFDDCAVPLPFETIMIASDLRNSSWNMAPTVDEMKARSQEEQVLYYPINFNWKLIRECLNRCEAMVQIVIDTYEERDMILDDADVPKINVDILYQ